MRPKSKQLFSPERDGKKNPRRKAKIGSLILRSWSPTADRANIWLVADRADAGSSVRARGALDPGERAVRPAEMRLWACVGPRRCFGSALVGRVCPVAPTVIADLLSRPAPRRQARLFVRGDSGSRPRLRAGWPRREHYGWTRRWLFTSCTAGTVAVLWCFLIPGIRRVPCRSPTSFQEG